MTRTGVRLLEQVGMGGGVHSTSTSSTVLLFLQMAMVQLHSHHVSFSCLGGSKFGHPGGLVEVGVLDAVDGRVVGVGGLGVEEGVGLEGVGVGVGVDGQDQLKNSNWQLSEQFT